VDAFYVIAHRLKNKKNPLNGDTTHLHHRLLKTGLTHFQVLSTIYFFSFVFGISSLFLDTQ
jgi:UDP-GlcNAc:undecaprenyl-phosphate GlcNAc-1-phosphate transferase